MVATTVLYGCHAVISGIVAFNAHSAAMIARPTSFPLYQY